MKLLIIILLFGIGSVSKAVESKKEYKLFRMKYFNDSLEKKIFEKGVNSLNTKEMDSIIFFTTNPVDEIDYDKYVVSRETKIYLEVYENGTRIETNNMNITSIETQPHDFKYIGIKNNKHTIKFNLASVKDKPKHLERMRIFIYENGVRLENGGFTIVYQNAIEFYGNLGFWIPLGVFSYEGTKKEEGLVFSSFPISLGWGGQLNFSNNFYIGLSLFLSFTSSDLSEQKKILINDVSAGLIFDISNGIFIGAATGYDTSTEKIKPHTKVLFSIQPQIIDLIKNIF